MPSYTIHLRHGGEDGARDVEVIKEGFHWLAFLFSGLWALFSRLWLVALAILALEIALAVGAAHFRFSPFLEALQGLVVALLLGFHGSDLKRWTLRRRGFRETALVLAPSGPAAISRFYDLNPGALPEDDR